MGPGGNREFNLASLVYDPEVKTHPFVLELWSGDELSGPFLKELIQRVRMATTLPLVFHPVSLEQEAVARRDLFEEDFVLTEDLYQGRTYWALNRGEAIGYLRLAEAAQCMDFKSIALFKKVPNDLGLVGGVITEEFQTPLSHVNVKSMNRGTVNMSLLGASGILGDLIDQPIRLFVGSGDYKVEPLDPAQAENQISRFWQKRRPLVNVDLGDPPADSDLKQFSKMFSRRPSPLEHQKLSRTVGAKATNLGLLHTVLPPLEQQRLEVKVPDGFGVPFAYFQIFLNTPQTGLDSKDLSREMTLAERVKDLLDQGDLLNPQKIHTTCEARPTLVQVREVFGKAKVPDALIAVLKYQIMENSESPIYYKKVPRIRLRSSTNSEDLDGFTGAGLYNSEGISFYKKDSDGFFRVDEFKGWKKIEEKLRELIPQIYAGVWNDRAYEEREWYQINGESHLKIQVGMAVHQAFYKKGFGRQRGEVANGVAIGRDIYTPNQEAKVYLNSQHGDLSVTNPPTEDEQKEYGIDPEAEYRTEEKIVTTFLADPLANSKPDAWKQWPVERLKTSTVNHGDEVLKSGDLEARRLARVMEYLDQKIAPIYETPLSQFALDVEWKLMGENRQLWIKQARPFSQPRVLSVE
ncbi:MAG: hypothetical protein KDD43_08905, partial [Bdellovibrionales bacterium]|nr:hypothetical protein [Bdellovibrionales bacterium]